MSDSATTRGQQVLPQHRPRRPGPWLLLVSYLRGAEEERTRIAAELHDGPIQQLTAVAYQLEEAMLTLGADGAGPRPAVDARRAREVLDAAQRDLHDEIGSLRRLMARLRPAALDERGLTLALADQLDSFERRTGIRCTLHSDHGARLEPEVETVLYRLVQEALTNVAKHAHATRVSVHLRAEEDVVELQVRDDGTGFDTARAPGLVGEGHYGLAGMRERVEMAGGTYRLRSAPGGGTAVGAQLPRRRASA